MAKESKGVQKAKTKRDTTQTLCGYREGVDTESPVFSTVEGGRVACEVFYLEAGLFLESPPEGRKRGRMRNRKGIQRREFPFGSSSWKRSREVGG